MKVTIKEFNVGMEVKTNGVEFEIRQPGDDGEHLGDLILTKTVLEWCDGRTRAGHGKQISWEKFIQWANSLP